MDGQKPLSWRNLNKIIPFHANSAELWSNKQLLLSQVSAVKTFCDDDKKVHFSFFMYRSSHKKEQVCHCEVAVSDVSVLSNSFFQTRDIELIWPSRKYLFSPLIRVTTIITVAVMYVSSRLKENLTLEAIMML